MFKSRVWVFALLFSFVCCFVCVPASAASDYQIVTNLGWYTTSPYFSPFRTTGSTNAYRVGPAYQFTTASTAATAALIDSAHFATRYSSNLAITESNVPNLTSVRIMPSSGTTSQGTAPIDINLKLFNSSIPSTGYYGFAMAIDLFCALRLDAYHADGTSSSSIVYPTRVWGSYYANGRYTQYINSSLAGTTAHIRLSGGYMNSSSTFGAAAFSLHIELPCPSVDTNSPITSVSYSLAIFPSSRGTSPMQNTVTWYTSPSAVNTATVTGVSNGAGYDPGMPDSSVPEKPVDPSNPDYTGKFDEVKDAIDSMGNKISSAIDNLDTSINQGLDDVEQAIKNGNEQASTERKGILQAILDLPKTLLDGFVHLFVPTQKDLEDIKYAYDDLLRDKFGLAYQAMEIFDSLFTSISDNLSSTAPYDFVFPGISFPMNGKIITILPETPVSLDNAVMDVLRPLAGTAVTLISVLAFVNMLKNFLESLLSGKSISDFDGSE